MTSSQAGVRYRAVSMEFAAYLDAQNVEMHIVTDKGETIVIVCPHDSILAIQKHIEQLAKACPEIATWSEQYPVELKRSEDPLRARITR